MVLFGAKNSRVFVLNFYFILSCLLDLFHKLQLVFPLGGFSFSLFSHLKTLTRYKCICAYFPEIPKYCTCLLLLLVLLVFFPHSSGQISSFLLVAREQTKKDLYFCLLKLSRDNKLKTSNE